MPGKKPVAGRIIAVLILLVCVYFVWTHFYSPKLNLQLQGKIEADNSLKLQAQLDNVGSTRLRDVSLYCSLGIDLPNLGRDITPQWTPGPRDPIVWADNLNAIVKNLPTKTPKPRDPLTYWTARSVPSGNSQTVPCIPNVPVTPQPGERIQVYAIFKYRAGGLWSSEKEERILFEGFPDPQGEISWNVRNWGRPNPGVFVIE